MLIMIVQYVIWIHLSDTLVVFLKTIDFLKSLIAKSIQILASMQRVKKLNILLHSNFLF